MRGLQGRDRLPRRRYPSRRRALRHGAHRGSRADDTEADGARHARPRPGPGGTGRHPPLRPSLAGTGMRGGPPSPARWHGPGRGVPPARGRGAAQARADRGGGLPEPPHPGGGGAERRARRRGDTGGARGDPSRRLSAGRVPADGGALQGYGYPPRRIA